MTFKITADMLRELRAVSGVSGDDVRLLQNDGSITKTNLEEIAAASDKALEGLNLTPTKFAALLTTAALNSDAFRRTSHNFGSAFSFGYIPKEELDNFRKWAKAKDLDETNAASLEFAWQGLVYSMEKAGWFKRGAGKTREQFLGEHASYKLLRERYFDKAFSFTEVDGTPIDYVPDNPEVQDAGEELSEQTDPPAGEDVPGSVDHQD